MLYEFFTHNYWASYLLVIVTVIFAYSMSGNVKSTFKKFSKISSRRGILAHQAARQILDSYGLYDVTVVRVDGALNDHYDIRKKIIALSDETFFSSSVAAIGVAAHEAGHAVQHAQGYIPIKIRNAFVPVVEIGSRAWLIAFIAGIFFSIPFLVTVGIGFFAVMVLFQIMTLPVEFNASKRALNSIKSNFILDNNEIVGTKKVLNAAAMTYVAGLMVSVAQLLNLIARTNRR